MDIDDTMDVRCWCVRTYDKNHFRIINIFVLSKPADLLPLLLVSEDNEIVNIVTSRKSKNHNPLCQIVTYGILGCGL